MANFRLVALDLDGTLLDDEKRVSARNLRVLRDLLSSGVKIAIASARDCASISQVVPINQPGLYYIASGGALIYDPHREEMIWADYLAPELVEESIKFFKQFEHPIFLNNVNEYWVDRYNERVQYIERHYTLQTKLFTAPSELKHQVMRVSLAAPVGILREAALLAEQTFDKRLTVSLASHDWLDLLRKEAGKGALLRFLQTMLGIESGQTMAIGDYESDLSLFDNATIRIAMGNAVDLVKESATYITASNNQDGVAQAIERYFSYADQEGSAL